MTMMASIAPLPFKPKRNLEEIVSRVNPHDGKPFIEYTEQKRRIFQAKKVVPQRTDLNPLAQVKKLEPLKPDSFSRRNSVAPKEYTETKDELRRTLRDMVTLEQQLNLMP